MSEQAAWNVGQGSSRGGPGTTPISYRAAQVKFEDIVPTNDAFAPSPIKPYQAQNELDRLRMGGELLPSTVPISSMNNMSKSNNFSTGVSSGGLNPAGWGAYNPPAREYSTTTQPSEVAQNAYNALQQGGDMTGAGIGGLAPQSSILQGRHASTPYQASEIRPFTQGSEGQPNNNNSNNNNNKDTRAGTTYTQVNGDPQTHTVTLSTTTYQPSGGNLVEAVDTYTYRRPETTNGEYGNFPRRGHTEHVVGGNSNVFANGGKIVKSGDKVVPLGGPGSAEERPGLARHGGITA
ncbi:hypothetical protein PhCBS80983_g00656 [Powellomyces hirtus]|uniref:Uncharacterized protein n=1 Tax=Powellomyces hirtus TaxID=109895 RepID=A0A507EEI5_9FUNG|nr:hypothetical protein PhCBS80983_g00656 [Powellomyces hirtus]